ncbi:MAG: hypothetical protein ACE5DX_01315 [Candidatus Dojkabacteria bacterium]
MFNRKHDRVIDSLLRQADRYALARGFKDNEIKQRMIDLEHQNEENKQHPIRVEVDVEGIGEVAVYISILGGKTAGSKTYITLGGGLSHAGSMKTLAFPIAALTGSRVIMLANVFNGESKIKSKDLRNRFYSYDKKHGGYTSDGLFYAQVLEKLHRQQLLGDQIELVGQSAGAAGLLRTAAYLKSQNSEIFHRIKRVTLISPAGVFPESDRSPILHRLIDLTRLRLGFIAETVNLVPVLARNRDPWINVFGEKYMWFLDPRDFLKLGARSVNPILSEVSREIATEISIYTGSHDKAFTYKTISRVVSDINKTRVPTVYLHMLDGNHSIMFTKAFEMAMMIADK